jgi:hypothetical protein
VLLFGKTAHTFPGSTLEAVEVSDGFGNAILGPDQLAERFCARGHRLIIHGAAQRVGQVLFSQPWAWSGWWANAKCCHAPQNG